MEIKPVATLAPPVAGHAGNAVNAADLSPASAADVTAKGAVTARAVQPVADSTATEQLNQALESINKSMRSLNADIEFSVEADTGRTLIRVTDKETGELLRQMPSKEALEIAKALDKVQGLLIRQKA